MNQKLIEAAEASIGFIDNLKDHGDNAEACEAIKKFLKEGIQEASKPTCTVILLDGGLIQDIFTDSLMEVVTIDSDTEDLLEQDLTVYRDRTGSVAKAYTRRFIVGTEDNTELNAEFVNNIFKEIK